MDIVPVLHEKIEAVAPIFGVSIGRRSNKASWRIDFKDEATLAQRTAAAVVLMDFDVVAEEHKIKNKQDAKRALKDALKADTARKVTVQELIDLELI